MKDQVFFDKVQDQFDQVLPFVIYRKPNETRIHAILQQNDDLHRVSNFTESGFVFAPFDTYKYPTVLIPTRESESISLSQEEIIVDNIALKPHSVFASGDAQAAHVELVEKAIMEIQSGRMKKVVLSRKQTLSYTSNSPLTIFKRLLSEYLTAFVYCWYHPKVGLWLGATPETLLSVTNSRLKTMSLAGTQKYAGNKSVVWGEKEIEEQALVTESIVNNLSPIVGNIEVGKTETHKAGSLLHLKTNIESLIPNSEQKLSDILKALHPTPAVCGLPKIKAKAFIKQNENYRRSYYTGFLGELNLKREVSRTSHRRNVENLAYRSVKKETNLFVNLRCMEIDSKGAQLYVGGGITESSDPLDEWEETVHKLETMRKVL